MTPEAQRIAIAQALRIKTFPRHDWDERDDRRYFICARCAERIGWRDYSRKEGRFDQPCSGDERNFPEDLNAMHDAEVSIPWDEATQMADSYEEWLDKLTRADDRKMWNATAAQRAEAFLRTLNLWQTQ